MLRKLGIECASDDSARDSSTSEDEDPETILRLPNGLKYRFVSGPTSSVVLTSPLLGKGDRWTSSLTWTNCLTQAMEAL